MSAGLVNLKNLSSGEQKGFSKDAVDNILSFIG